MLKQIALGALLAANPATKDIKLKETDLKLQSLPLLYKRVCNLSKRCHNFLISNKIKPDKDCFSLKLAPFVAGPSSLPNKHLFYNLLRLCSGCSRLQEKGEISFDSVAKQVVFLATILSDLGYVSDELRPLFRGYFYVRPERNKDTDLTFNLCFMDKELIFLWINITLAWLEQDMDVLCTTLPSPWCGPFDFLK